MCALMLQHLLPLQLKLLVYQRMFIVNQKFATEVAQLTVGSENFLQAGIVKTKRAQSILSFNTFSCIVIICRFQITLVQLIMIATGLDLIKNKLNQAHGRVLGPSTHIF
jgi:hypothetical protein